MQKSRIALGSSGADGIGCAWPGRAAATVFTATAAANGVAAAVQWALREGHPSRR